MGLLRAKEAQRLPATRRSQGRGVEPILPHRPQEEPALLTPRSLICSFQNCEAVNFCSVSHPVSGTPTRQPCKRMHVSAVACWLRFPAPVCGGNERDVGRGRRKTAVSWPCQTATVLPASFLFLSFYVFSSSSPSNIY